MNNAISALLTRKIIIAKEGARGTYRLQDKGFAVTAASTTADALRAMVEQEFDLVITDLVMCFNSGTIPEADGREVTLAAKRSSEKTKVIIFTAYAQMSKDLIKAGADAVISKGSSITDLLKKIEALLGRPHITDR